MKIHLHVGAHKTATTFIQHSLAANLEVLNRRGIGYLPLAKQRLLGRAIKDTPPEGFDFGAFSSAFFTTPPEEDEVGIIISDENLLGECYRLVSHGDLYPNASQRLGRLRALLGGHEVTLFFAVRSYETFLVSAYCEVMRNRSLYVPFTEYKDRLAAQAYRWPGVFSRIVDAVQPGQVVVWRYEDFPRDPAAVVRKLAFDYDHSLQFPAAERKVQRRSFSGTAMDVLATVAERHGPELAGALVKFVDEGLPKGRRYPAFDPWNEREKAELQSMYHADCSALPVQIWDVAPPDRRTRAQRKRRSRPAFR